MKRCLIFLLCLFLFSYGIGAQESETDTESEKKAETNYIEMDIRTSSLMELAAWCRELGLPEGGAREELASRLRTYYGITSGAAAQASTRIITIESAKTTEYFTLDAVDEEYARLKGDVVVSLRDGGAVHRIKAHEILYNRTRNVMTASGNVEYIKEEGDSRESFKGESITVNLDNWSSIFMDGASEKSKAGTGAAYRFAGTVISRNDEEVTVLTGAEITNAANEESFWSLYASKLWLLPGNDWAILNAVLKIGNIPVLYLPAFYYPADQIVFHPVLGVRTREGTFLQTTTYLLGQPRADALAENSLTKIFGSASDEAGRTREGIFIRRTGEKKMDPSNILFKLIFDSYVNLGFYLGTELELPRKGSFGETKLDAGVGLTRDIYNYGASFTPYIFGESNWNFDNNFFGLNSPLRFRIKANGSAQFKYGTLQWDLPYYSDPFVDRDFTRRSELLDWFAMLRDGVSNEETETYDPLSSYEWKLGGTFNPRVTVLSPFINSFSLNNISSSLSFGIKPSKEFSIAPLPPYSVSWPNPKTSFFYPNRLTIASMSGSVSGTPLTLGAVPGRQPRTGAIEASSVSKLPVIPGLPDLPVSPWDENTKMESAEEQDAEPGTDEVPRSAYEFTIPVLAQRFNIGSTGSSRFTIDYRLSPTVASEMKFDSGRWDEQKDIQWNEYSSILTSLGSAGNIGLGMSHTAGLYSASLGFTGNASWKRYHLNDEATEYETPDRRKIAHDQADRETFFTSSWDFSSSVRPFFQNAVWGNTSVNYSLRGHLAKNTVDTLGGTRSWTLLKDWDKDNIHSHQVSTNINANIMDYRQTLSVSAVLPPLDSAITANATLNAGITETNVVSQINNVWSWEDGDITFSPIRITETIRFSNWGSFRGHVVIDPDKNSEKDGADRLNLLTADLRLWGFSAAFSASYARTYSYDNSFGSSGGGGQLWILDEAYRFAPRDLSFRYTKNFEVKELWKDRLAFSININTGLRFDLLRYTNSNFNFTLGFNMRVTNFLNIQFGTRSENNVIYRYRFVRGMLFFLDHPEGLYGGQEDRLIVDLFKSFNFFNETSRRESGFKLKEMNISLIHHLGDWNAQLKVSMTPYRPQGSTSFVFRRDIEFLVQWVPIQEMRTEVIYRGEENKLTVK